MSFVRMVTREKLNNLPTVSKVGGRIYIQGDEYFSRLFDMSKCLENAEINDNNIVYHKIYHRNLKDSYYHKEFIEEYEK